MSTFTFGAAASGGGGGEDNPFPPQDHNDQDKPTVEQLQELLSKMKLKAKKWKKEYETLAIKVAQQDNILKELQAPTLAVSLQVI
jgi:hypothetical protein